MKTALITTTINVPRVLELYRKFGPDVRFFVAGDQKTPHGVLSFCEEMDDCVYLGVGRQAKFGYKCSELIGWNCIQRRNIALLEALKWGADLIVSIDDDNIPLDAGYFRHFERLFTAFRILPTPFHGVQISSPVAGWFDPGELFEPPTKHRGFPQDVNSEFWNDVNSEFWNVGHVTDAKVGVAAGLCLGDPDIDAVTRMVLRPSVHAVSELGRAGVVVDPSVRTVWNSQNTAFIRELAPAMFMMPGIGRYDDIFASLVCQRVMRDRGLHAHFGQPFVWQQRNQHNLLNDLDAEMYGMRTILPFADALNGVILPDDGSVLDHVKAIYSHHSIMNLLPTQAVEAAMAWCEDVGQVLG